VQRYCLILSIPN